MSKPGKYRSEREQGVAPSTIIRNDYSNIASRSALRCSSDFAQLLYIQSVEGHCHAGYGVFYGKTYPNTNQEDIAKALRLNPKQVRYDRQSIIDEISALVDRVAAGEKITWACNAENQPLTLVGFLRYVPLDARRLVQGLYIGGLRDERRVRELANRKYGCDMGYGKNYLISRSVMNSLGLDGYDLAHIPHQHEMERLRVAGLFDTDEENDTIFQYIRHKTGMGASDDLAIIFAGLMLGCSAAVGCYLADAVDTLEKFADQTRDQDAEISSKIRELMPDIGITDEDAADLAYLCAIPDDMKGKLPDSSLRHLLEIDQDIDQCALESHIAFVKGLAYSDMQLDHGECTNVELYEYVSRRWENFLGAK